MTLAEIVAEVKRLGLPPRSYVVFGSGPLAAAGIREAGDVDLLVSPEVFRALQEAGWEKAHKGPGDEPLTRDHVEVHDNWNFSPYRPTLENLLSSAREIDGVAFAALEEVRKWKAASGREKDKEDIERIDAFLARERSEQSREQGKPWGKFS